MVSWIFLDRLKIIYVYHILGTDRNLNGTKASCGICEKCKNRFAFWTRFLNLLWRHHLFTFRWSLSTRGWPTPTSAATATSATCFCAKLSSRFAASSHASGSRRWRHSTQVTRQSTSRRVRNRNIITGCVTTTGSSFRDDSRVKRCWRRHRWWQRLWRPRRTCRGRWSDQLTLRETSF